MGAFIHVRVPKAADLDAMKSFMGEHFTPGPTLFPWLEAFVAEDPRVGYVDQIEVRVGTDICAYSLPNDIGFYCGAGWLREEREYASGLIRWMALKVGPGRKVRSYMYEDLVRKVFVASGHPTKPDGWDRNHDLVDEVGFTPSTRGSPEELATWTDEDHYLTKEVRRMHRSDPLIRGELARLDALWRVRGPGGS